MTYRHLPALLMVLLAAACASEAPGDEAPASQSGSEALDGAATITFGASGQPQVSGALRVGGKTDVSYDPARLQDCRGSKYGYPAWAISGFYQIGQGPVVSFTAVKPNQDGTVTTKATIDLYAEGDLAVWFQNSNAFGCSAWDSVYGANYHFGVQPSPSAPGWLGNAASIVSRNTCDNGGGCDADRRPLEQGFTIDTWARERAAIRSVYFEAWKQGVTDFNNPQLWQQLNVQVYYRYAGQTAFTTQYVDFDRYVGNNARYQLPLRPLDPLGGYVRTTVDQCPAAALTATPDGQYVRTTVDYFFVVNGVELRPAPGQTYQGTFEDYRSTFAVCLAPLQAPRHRRRAPPERWSARAAMSCSFLSSTLAKGRGSSRDSRSAPTSLRASTVSQSISSLVLGFLRSRGTARSS